MKVIPYEKYSFKSNLTAEEAISKLKENVEPNKIFRMGGGEKVFQGNVYSHNFEISRIISYRNSFLPQIKGNIKPNNNSIIIDIKMHLHPFVIVFLFIWFVGVILGCIVTATVLIYSLIQGSALSPGLIIPFAMLAFGIGLSTIPFWSEVKKAKSELNKIFNNHSEEGKHDASFSTWY